MPGQESVEQWKKFDVINYERSEGPSSDSSLHVDCRSVMFDLGRELQLHSPHIFAGWRNFLFTIWTFPSTLFLSKHNNAEEYFWILRMELFPFSPIGSTLEAKARRCNEPTNPANTFLFPRCQMRTFFVAYFFLVPNTYIFPWPTTHLLFICVTFDIKS